MITNVCAQLFGQLNNNSPKVFFELPVQKVRERGTNTPFGGESSDTEFPIVDVIGVVVIERGAKHHATV